MGNSIEGSVLAQIEGSSQGPSAGQMVTQSRFFSSAFNTAIIDGPLRIYFADRQESEALQIYFEIQEGLARRGLKLNSFPLDIPNTFLMLYPDAQSFVEVFDKEEEVVADQFGKHFVLGVNGPCEPERRQTVCGQVCSIFENSHRALDE